MFQFFVMFILALGLTWLFFNGGVPLLRGENLLWIGLFFAFFIHISPRHLGL